MSDHRTFHNADEALCYMVEVTMATLEVLKLRKSSSKADIRRHEAIVETGLRYCISVGLAETAEKTRCFRVSDAIIKARGTNAPSY